MKFKTKILTSVLAVGLTVALIGGSTMAWFTDSKEVKGATFQAGTVTIGDATSKEIAISGIQTQNVNPGDTFTAKLDIVYTGTKPAKLRIKLPTLDWWNDQETTDPLKESGKQLTTENLDLTDYTPKGWAIKGDYAYYTGSIKYTGTDGKEYTLTDGILPGIKDDVSNGTTYYGSVDPTTISITLTGKFDGAKTDNKYQGKTFKIGDSVLEVIQATNDAETKDDNWAKGTPVPAAATTPAA